MDRGVDHSRGLSVAVPGANRGYCESKRIDWRSSSVRRAARRKSRRTFLRILLAFAVPIILILACVIAFTSAPSSEIRARSSFVSIEVVSESCWGFNSVAIDSNDKVHIAYSYDGDHLYYSTNAGGEWLIQPVDGFLALGDFCSIAVDSNNKAHISYFDRMFPGALKYANNTGGSWERQVVDSGSVGTYTSIAIDSNDKVHISYYDFGFRALKYVTNAGGLWFAEMYDWQDVGMYTSIAIDSNDVVHISYTGWDDVDSDWNLKYISNPGGFWTPETIDGAGTTGSTGLYTSIAIDPNDDVHISYYDEANTDLRYATNTSGSWVCCTLDSVGDVGNYSSIAVDSDGYVHISYYDETNADLKYVTNADGEWDNCTLDSDEDVDVGQYTSIAVDSYDRIHISYFDRTNYDLKYACDSEVIPEFSSPAVVVGVTIAMVAVFIALRRREKRP